MSIDELIKAANQLNEADLNQLLHQIVFLRARRKTPILPEEEAQLLLRINQGIPSDLRSSYQALREKRDAETLMIRNTRVLSNLATKLNKLVLNVSKPWLSSRKSVKFLC